MSNQEDVSNIQNIENDENVIKPISGEIKESPLSDENVKWQALRWKNRRKMAWFSLYSLISIVLMFFFVPISDSRLAIIAEPISMMAFVFGGVIGAYMGFTSYEKGKLGK